MLPDLDVGRIFLRPLGVVGVEVAGRIVGAGLREIGGHGRAGATAAGQAAGERAGVVAFIDRVRADRRGDRRADGNGRRGVGAAAASAAAAVHAVRRPRRTARRVRRGRGTTLRLLLSLAFLARHSVVLEKHKDICIGGFGVKEIERHKNQLVPQFDFVRGRSADVMGIFC